MPTTTEAKRCLIAYHSKYGQTQKIAERIGDELAATRQMVESMNLSDSAPLKSIEPFDVVIVGGPIYTAHHSGALLQFISANRNELSKKETGFFSVSLSAAGDEEQQGDALWCQERFLAGSGWKPTHCASFAGGVAYRDYNWFMRWIMKRIVRGSGGPTDTSRNHELTNWDQVEQFAREFTATTVASSESDVYSDHKMMRPPSARV